jgi:small subunit ribosomal protein S17e
VDRIKRLSFEVLDEHKSKFGEDFVENKKALNQISIIRSKGLKNKIAGYITRFIKKQIREEKVKQDRSNYDSSNTEEQESEDVSETVEEITLTNEEVEALDKPIKEITSENIMVSASDIVEEDSILKSNSDNTSEEKTD